MQMAATLGGQAVGVSSFVSSSSSSYFSHNAKSRNPSTMVCRLAVASPRIVACSAVQESTSTETEEAKAAPKAAAAAAKPKAPAKAPTKPLPQLMEEEVIPPLLEILQSQDDLSEIELSFQDNRLDGSFLKEGNRYSFWAFFPTGDLTGPKGFALSSYGSEASTVEPFLVDEKRVTGKLVVFWVEKRLAAQGIIPVWKE
ncbi:uncharacterized protein LOC115676140 isoform X2 [Syzygium oleosum]|uniref:uncharacterized protein LOC115676140 isoform X2 n=1 Tax=Syzygium oleosum TaxID=219896 RepID=UPI0024BB146D|nr:uncharacterized protein LOC115676140 isoform X2 [Syzygium oleosum]